ncbi:MAG: hypothetical protein ACOH2H_10120, partial [Cypionkella sp.]
KTAAPKTAAPKTAAPKTATRKISTPKTAAPDTAALRPTCSIPKPPGIFTGDGKSSRPPDKP